jgi:hypothetical protein
MDDFPKSSKGDLGHVLIKAGLNLVPVIGGTASELFGLVIAPPLAKRRDEWLQKLAETLKDLEHCVNGFKVESLRENEVFVSAVLQATQAALRTHEREKLEALRNALLHVAVSKPQQEDMQIFYIGLIDSFTVTHIEILRAFEHPSASGIRRSELGKRRTITDSLVMDLNARGLLVDPRPVAARNRESSEALVLIGWKPSDLGREFLNFISKPFDS